MSSNKVTVSVEQLKRRADKAIAEAERLRAERDAAYAQTGHKRADELLVAVASRLVEADMIGSASVSPVPPDPDTANVSAHTANPSRPPPSTTPAHRKAARAFVGKIRRAVSEFDSAVANDFPKHEDSRVQCWVRGCDRYGKRSGSHHHCQHCGKSTVTQFCGLCGTELVIEVDVVESLKMESR